MRFETTLSQFGNNTGIEVPADVIEALGAGKRPAVRITVNGYEYRSTVGVMNGLSLVPFSSDKRAATGIAGGDPIAVDIDLDTAPREVEVPTDLAGALDGAGVRAAFDALAPSRRKAHVVAVEGAKAAETRARRIAAVVSALGD
ncbi:YdeI/OmpD-associated family protein [Microbacterium sp. cx-55]|uniref:YdeI/OmpD-associated family protein n=1 Tax=Microbacterium sp. cx-55 TaxID=2875948 RepID=UPI001CC04A5D|nr:YdeI/OmpD-associated family protein [Microbacterium sp. cx-55]MBZ4487669.1 YdeI/OmpD-associated family protein [Microbacterium sp. cx-55]UGB35681.1 YdeI/OmpD-associated family protein [Microbacterium sp. cx-55]